MMTSVEGKPLTSIKEFRHRAEEVMDPEGWAFYEGQAGRETTYRDSEAAFDRYVIRPRILRDVTRRSLATTVLGQPISMPICVAPTACHGFAHPEAEKATAHGAARADTLFVLSHISNTPIADVAKSAPNGLKWMAMYMMRNKALNRHVITEAEKAGFKAIVLTVDVPFVGVSCATHNSSQIDERKRCYSDPQLCLRNLLLDLPEIRAAIRSGDINLWSYEVDQASGPLTWDDVTWLKTSTSLPVVLKGILTAEAAIAAADAGVAGIIVSAHGGRHLDGVPAPLDALVEVVNAVKDRDIEVYMDGGIRSGTDVFKAIGLGARAVFIGRPALWGLACEGSTGVASILSILRGEFDTVLGLSGCNSPQDIPPSMVVRKSFL